VELGEPFGYTTELSAGVDYRNGGWALASANLGAVLVGIERSGSGQGEEVPEPGPACRRMTTDPESP